MLYLLLHWFYLMVMKSIISINNLGKIYEGGFIALSQINLDIYEGEILAMLGPNGAGKTTLISIICGIANATSGSVSVNGNDIVADYRKTRSLIGLVPQELHTDAFETAALSNQLCKHKTSSSLLSPKAKPVSVSSPN